MPVASVGSACCHRRNCMLFPMPRASRTLLRAACGREAQLAAATCSDQMLSHGERVWRCNSNATGCTGNGDVFAAPFHVVLCVAVLASVWCAFLCCAQMLIRLASGLPCLLRVRAAGAFASGDPTRRLGTCVRSQDERTAGRISRSANALLARRRSWRVRVPRGPAPPFPRTPYLLSAVPEDGFNREIQT